MPQVITGFDRFAQAQRQREQDKRQAALQDAQEQRAQAAETRAASTFEMARQDRTEAKARQVKLDVQADEDRELNRQKATLGVVAGATEQLMATASPMPVNGAFAPLLAYVADESKIPTIATVETQYGGDNAPSSFVYRDATGNEVARVGLQDPEAMAVMSGRVQSGQGENWFLGGTFLDPNTGEWSVTQVKESTGETRKTTVGIPASQVDKTPGLTPGEIAQTTKLSWEIGLADEVMDLIPQGMIDTDFDGKTPQAMSLSIRRLLGSAAPGSPEEKQLRQALAKLKEVQNRMKGVVAPGAGQPTPPDPLGGMGGSGDVLDGVF